MKTNVKVFIEEALILFAVKKYKTIIFSATDNAISKVALAAEILKHRVCGLHQFNFIKTV